VPLGGSAPSASGLILADPGWEYLVYFRSGDAHILDLTEALGRLRMVWFNTSTGEATSEQSVTGGRYVRFHAPDTNDWVLYICRRTAAIDGK
jgi:hypothetical protein